MPRKKNSTVIAKLKAILAAVVMLALLGTFPIFMKTFHQASVKMVDAMNRKSTTVPAPDVSRSHGADSAAIDVPAGDHISGERK